MTNCPHCISLESQLIGLREALDYTIDHLDHVAGREPQDDHHVDLVQKKARAALLSSEKLSVEVIERWEQEATRKMMEEYFEPDNFAGVRFAMMMIARQAVKMNATNVSHEIEGLTYNDEPLGDWKVTVESIHKHEIKAESAATEWSCNAETEDQPREASLPPTTQNKTKKELR